MENEWHRGVLLDVVELKRGYDLPHATREPGSVPVVSSSGVTGLHSRAKVRAPGVVVGRYATQLEQSIPAAARASRMRFEL